MVSREQFREALAGVCAPVTVVTTVADGRPFGATVSAIASLSLQPPLLTVALDRRSRVLPVVLQTKRFGVNVLSADQEDIATLFATRDADRFGGVEWDLEHGLPRLRGAGGYLVCGVAAEVAGGDHALLIGEVQHTAQTDAPPLIYARRLFGTHSKLQGIVSPASVGSSTVR